MKAAIAPHDIAVKAKQAQKHLAKNHRLRIVAQHQWRRMGGQKMPVNRAVTRAALSAFLGQLVYKRKISETERGLQITVLVE